MCSLLRFIMIRNGSKMMLTGHNFFFQLMLQARH